jgi:hypothetical protein
VFPGELNEDTAIESSLSEAQTIYADVETPRLATDQLAPYDNVFPGISGDLLGLLHGCCTGARITFGLFISASHFSCKICFFIVEPRGIEPLTSAVQMRIQQFTSVH